MSTGVIIALIAILAIPGWFFGGFLLKIIWGWWPVIVFPTLGGWAVYQDGMESFIYLPVSIVASIVVTWLWQRTPVFLKVDEIIGKITFIN